MKQLFLIAIVCTCFATWVLAQDPERTTPEQPAQAASKAKQPTTSTDDGYLPSEEISDDLSVSFPVDI